MFELREAWLDSSKSSWAQAWLETKFNQENFSKYYQENLSST